MIEQEKGNTLTYLPKRIQNTCSVKSNIESLQLNIISNLRNHV